MHLGYRLVLFFYYIKTTERIRAKIVTDSLNKVLCKPQKYFNKYGPGLILNKINDLNGGLSEFIDALVNWVLLNICITFSSSIYLLFIVPKLALVILYPLIVTIIAIVLAWPRLKELEAKYFTHNGTNQDTLNDLLSNSLCVRLFNTLSYEKNNQKQRFVHLIKYNEKINWVYMFMFIVYDITIISMLFLQFYLLLKEWKSRNISTENFSLIIIQSSMIQSSLWQIVLGVPDLFRNYSKMNQAFKVIDEEEPEDVLQGKKLEISGGGIECKQVCFGYKKGSKLFNDFSLKINPGECIGLVGESGAGKTTFVNLLIKSYKPNEGEILIDGQNIAEISHKSVRNHIGIIPQSPLLFNDSIYNNIRYGSFNASDEEIETAAKLANAHDFIIALPEGYYTQTSELSGGQKQRISIARAILKNPSILILDEATSQLDLINESIVQASIDKLAAGRTTIIIAHRLSTLKKVDRILVFKDGNIVESGKHEDLLKQKGEYFKLYQAGQRESSI
jgi:ATP-binding cassette subfamily B protein